MYRLCQGCIFFRINLPRGGDEKSKGNFFILFGTNYPKIN